MNLRKENAASKQQLQDLKIQLDKLDSEKKILEQKLTAGPNMTAESKEYQVIKKHYEQIKEASLKLKTEYDDLEFSNAQLQQVLIKANDESNSKILALEISLKESNDAYRVAESERLKLQEQMSTLYKIFDTVVNPTRTGVRNTSSGEVDIDAVVQTVPELGVRGDPVVGGAGRSESSLPRQNQSVTGGQQLEVENEDDFEKTLEILSVNKNKGFNRKNGPTAAAEKNPQDSVARPSFAETVKNKTAAQRNQEKVVSKQNINISVNEKIMNRNVNPANINVDVVKTVSYTHLTLPTNREV